MKLSREAEGAERKKASIFSEGMGYGVENGSVPVLIRLNPYPISVRSFTYK
jgi:hypothetical protein